VALRVLRNQTEGEEMNAYEIFMAGVLSGLSSFLVVWKFRLIWSAISSWLNEGVDTGD